MSSCVLRIGQTELVQMFEISNTNSLQSKVISNTVKKVLVGTITELDAVIRDVMEVTGIPTGNTEINIGRWHVDLTGGHG